MTRLLDPTRYVRSECCDAPVRLMDPDFPSETAGVCCVRCRREAGRPGPEDASEVAYFLTATTPLTLPSVRNAWVWWDKL